MRSPTSITLHLLEVNRCSISLSIPPGIIGAMEDLVEHVVPLPGRELLVLAPRDGDSLLTEQAFAQEEFLPYWVELWPSAVALARVVARRPLTGRRVLELGCGLGLPALAAARRAGGCSPRTGRPTRSPWPRATRRTTALELATAEFRWDADPEPLGPPWPLVLASDVLYERRNLAPLLALLPRVTAAAGRCGSPTPAARSPRSSWSVRRRGGGSTRFRTTGRPRDRPPPAPRDASDPAQVARSRGTP